jgi:hypothetical protein
MLISRVVDQTPLSAERGQRKAKSIILISDEQALLMARDDINPGITV